MAFVVDTSVTMAWCFQDEATSSTEELLDRLREEEAHVPELWRLEVTNVLLVAERRGRIREAQSRRFVDLLERLPIRVAPSAGSLTEVLDLGRRHRLSAYDAAYLELAERLGTPLATLDGRLVDACRTAGVVRLGS
ncbi:type II toxin-antitoxin system VapC family toxin [Georgenia sunbinii]|uniref:type II toxin-antitoxin system VapC family toxin n=1 Tax=Georgenia sunbinii TaxID=3117728 RepID=UPI002F269296